MSSEACEKQNAHKNVPSKMGATYLVRWLTIESPKTFLLASWKFENPRLKLSFVEVNYSQPCSTDMLVCLSWLKSKILVPGNKIILRKKLCGPNIIHMTLYGHSIEYSSQTFRKEMKRNRLWANSKKVLVPGEAA